MPYFWASLSMFLVIWYGLYVILAKRKLQICEFTAGNSNGTYCSIRSFASCLVRVKIQPRFEMDAEASHRLNGRNHTKEDIGVISSLQFENVERTTVVRLLMFTIFCPDKLYYPPSALRRCHYRILAQLFQTRSMVVLQKRYVGEA
jgi:hypothetical protein